MAQYENYAPYVAGVDTLEAVNTLFRKVYQYMALGLVLTSLTAWLTASSPAMLQMFYGSSAPLIIVAVAEIGLVIYLSATIAKHSASTSLMLFGVYSVLNGITCSAVLLVYTAQSVYTAFLSTAGMFGAMSLYALYTQRDITSWGSFLHMGLLGLIVAMVINIFFDSTMAETVISVRGKNLRVQEIHSETKILREHQPQQIRDLQVRAQPVNLLEVHAHHHDENHHYCQTY